jgi:hypothetical protein
VWIDRRPHTDVHARKCVPSALHCGRMDNTGTPQQCIHRRNDTRRARHKLAHNFMNMRASCVSCISLYVWVTSRLRSTRSQGRGCAQVRNITTCSPMLGRDDFRCPRSNDAHHIAIMHEITLLTFKPISSKFCFLGCTPSLACMTETGRVIHWRYCRAAAPVACGRSLKGMRTQVCKQFPKFLGGDYYIMASFSRHVKGLITPLFETVNDGEQACLLSATRHARGPAADQFDYVWHGNGHDAHGTRSHPWGSCW